ncbi:MAG: sulfotransferase [Bacteroidota bacterium]
MNLYSLKVAYYDLKCELLRGFRGWKNLWAKEVPHRFVFVLCPTYCGSTLMQELLSTSPQVSANNVFGVREGLSLPQVRKLFDYRQLWTDGYEMPWLAIRAEWMKYWDRSRAILLEKSPSNILQMQPLAQYFAPSSFVLMVRHPYAHCESLIRRDGYTAEAAARFSLRCLHQQKKNLELDQSSLLIRYEDLVRQPLASARQLEAFLPKLSPLRIQGDFKAHNYKNKPLPITDLNKEKIQRLSQQQKATIDAILLPQEEILSYFSYSLASV